MRDLTVLIPGHCPFFLFMIWKVRHDPVYFSNFLYAKFNDVLFVEILIFLTKLIKLPFFLLIIWKVVHGPIYFSYRFMQNSMMFSLLKFCYSRPN